jgi:hypothetical protein
MDEIRVIDQFHYHLQVVFGLDVHTDDDRWPKLVGCSLLSPAGNIHDLPARWLRSPGLALWDVRATTELSEFRTDSGGVGGYMAEYGGQAIFALWSDDSFSNRLADTGWVAWQALWMIGGSITSLDRLDEVLHSRYKDRFDVWSNAM